MLLSVADQAKKRAPFMAHTTGEWELTVTKAPVFMNVSTYSAILSKPWYLLYCLSNRSRDTDLAVDASSRYSMVKVVQRRAVIAVQFPMSARSNATKAAA
jgi:hypothetical protein